MEKGVNRKEKGREQFIRERKEREQAYNDLKNYNEQAEAHEEIDLLSNRIILYML